MQLSSWKCGIQFIWSLLQVCGSMTVRRDDLRRVWWRKRGTVYSLAHSLGMRHVIHRCMLYLLAEDMMHRSLEIRTRCCDDAVAIQWNFHLFEHERMPEDDLFVVMVWIACVTIHYDRVALDKIATDFCNYWTISLVVDADLHLHNVKRDEKTKSKCISCCVFSHCTPICSNSN